MYCWDIICTVRTVQETYYLALSLRERVQVHKYVPVICTSRVKFTARRGQLVKPIVKPNLALMCHWLFFQASSSTYPSAKNKVGCQIFIFDVVMSNTIFQYSL